MNGGFLARAHAHDPKPPGLNDVEVELLRLSPREVEVLELIACGLGTQDIADRMYLSVNSVKTHTRNMFRKMGVDSRTQAAVWVWSRPEGWWRYPDP